jgi:hypothetical protein
LKSSVPFQSFSIDCCANASTSANAKAMQVNE